MEPLTLSTSIYRLLGDEEHNPERPTERNLVDANAGDVIRCRTWVIMNTNLGDPLSTIITDYAFPTSQQACFLRAYATLVRTRNIVHCDQGARNTLAIARLAVMQDVNQFLDVSDSLQNNKQVVLDTVRNNGNSLANVRGPLRVDIDVNIAAVTQNGYAFLWVFPQLQNNKKIVIAAVTQNADVLENVVSELCCKELQSDPDVLRAAGK